jgi:hypothetical protein
LVEVVRCWWEVCIDSCGNYVVKQDTSKRTKRFIARSPVLRGF